MNTRRPPVRMSDCRECADPIVWAMLDTGKRIPLNPLPNPDKGNVACRVVGGNLHGYVISKDHPADPLFLRMVPHFSTCEARTQSSRPADPALF